MKLIKKSRWIFCLGLAAVSSLSDGVASVPRQSAIAPSSLSEIRATKALEPSFDADVNRLAQLEGRYQEKLPGLRDVRGGSRLAGPVKRMNQQKYRYSGK